jgi:hypothetical protein
LYSIPCSSEWLIRNSIYGQDRNSRNFDEKLKKLWDINDPKARENESTEIGTESLGQFG